MRIKKLFVIMICVAMVFTATQTTYSYADDSDPPTVYIQSVSATQGSSVTVTVGIRNAVNLGGLDVSVFYDSEAFTVQSVSKGSFVNGASVSINTNNPGVVRESIVAMDGLNGSGYLMTVTFNVAENAAIKDYDIAVGIGEAFDTSFNDITVNGTPGTITVIQNPVIQRVAYFNSNVVPSEPVSEGDEVHFKVIGSETNGLAGGVFEFTYDSDLLEFTDVTLGSELISNTAIYSVNSRTPGLVRITYAEVEAITSNYGVEFFDLAFNVKQNTATSTTVTFSGSSLLDGNLNSMTTNGTSSVINIAKKKASLYVDWDGSQNGDREFTVDVILTGDNNVGAGDFWISYDTSKLSCVEAIVDPSVADSGAYLVTHLNISDGKVPFSYVNANGCSTDSTLLHITFRQLHDVVGDTEFTPGGKNVVDKDLNNLTLIYPVKSITLPYDEGHVLTPTEATEPTCTESGNTAYWTCTICGKYFSDPEWNNEIEEGSWVVDALGHDLIHHDAQAPTCTEIGWEAYDTCSRCDYTTYSELSSIGHDWGEPTYVWADDGSEITATRICANDATHVETEKGTITSEVTTSATCETKGKTTYTATFENEAFKTQTKEIEDVPALGHDWDDGVVTTPATCTEDGVKTFTCRNDNTHTKTEVIPATDHAWGTPTYVWAEDGSEITATRVCANDPAHVETEKGTITSEVTTPATCEAKGKTTYTATFENEAFKAQTKEIEDVPALGHDWDDGVVTTPATCLTDGVKTFTCRNDSTHTRTEVIPATGHDWGEPTYVWAEDNSAVTATRICLNDATHIETETVSTTSEITTPATCETKGKTTYTATFENEVFEEQTKTVEDVDATGHNWGEPVYVWADDNGSVTATRVCGNDPTHIETETVNTTSEITTPPTCEAKGKTTYTATFENEAFGTQTKTVENVDALGHTPGEAVIENEVPATCTTAGSYDEVVYCEVCGAELSRETRTIDPSHTPGEVVIENEVPATCTTAGSCDEVVYCEVCGIELSREAKVIEALGHAWGEPEYEWAEDYSTVTGTRICTRDESHVETETVETTVEEVSPGCEEEGQYLYYADFTNPAFYVDPYSEVIPPLGHDWEFIDFTWTGNDEDGYTAAIANYICRSNEEHTYVVPAEISVETKEATCTDPDTITYTATVSDEYAIDGEGRTDSKVVTGQALGHAWGEPEYEWADDFSRVTGTRICANDQSHVETETVETTVDEAPPTCEEEGELVYSAVFTNPAFDVEPYAEILPPLGHDWKFVGFTWTGNDEDGYTAAVANYICLNDEEHTNTAPAEISIETKNATCTEPNTITYTAAVSDEDALDGEGRTDSKVVTGQALGHDYEFTGWDWAEDYSAAFIIFTCKRDSSHVATVEAVVTTERTEPTCETAGSIVYVAKATFENSEFTNSRSVVIDPLGHKWGEPTYIWAEDNSTVTATRVCGNDTSHVETETANALALVTKPATCEEKGETTYSVTFVNPAFEEQSKTLENIDAIGHDWEEPTYEWADDYSTVTAARICANDPAHVQTETVNTTSQVTKEATCEEQGETTYTATFENEAFAVQTKTIVNIDALGHAWGEPAYVWADDNSTVTATRVCANDPTHVETETVNATAEITKPATCENKGETTYSATFTNPAFEDQSKTLENVDALGHRWGEPAYAWADDYSTVTATRICANDPAHVQTETVNTTSEVTKEATCEEQGETTYTATFENEAFTVQTKTIVNIDALGHAWGEPAYVWAEDNSTVTATRICSNDATHVETEIVSTTSEVTRPATCEAKGETTYTATFENDAFEIQTKAVENIPALGHAWGEPTYVWADDNSVVTATRVCANDPAHVQTETVNTTSEITKEATCEEQGETTYTATFTNEAFGTKAKTVDDIPALGHRWQFVELVWSGNDDEGYNAATAYYKCLNNEEHTGSVAAVITKETSDATCTTPGTVTYIADISEAAALDGEPITDSKVVTGQALGHDYELTSWNWADDNSSATATFTCKNDSSHVETAEATVTTIRTEPTCETDGSIVYVAKVTFEDKEYTNSRSVELAAFGHAWGAPAYVWAEDNSTVTATRVCGNDAAHVETETVDVTSEVTTPATCEAKGRTTYTATFENEAFETQTKTLENIDALGHAWGEPTYVWADDNSKVTATRVCGNDPTHIETEEAATTSEITKPAGCETKGETTYTATFENAAFETQTRVLEDIPATGHTPVTDPAVTATCTETGLTEGSHCSTCGKVFVAQEIVPALGHAWGEPAYVWTDDNSKVTATRVCGNDAAHVETETVSTTSAVTKPATCEVNGETTYTATFENEAFETQTKTIANIDALGHDWDEGTVTTAPTCTENGVKTFTCKNDNSHTRTEVIPATGHDWSAPSYEWSADNRTVTATRVCENDPTHVETETVGTTSEVVSPATCDSNGEAVYTSAAFNNDAFAVQTKTVVIPATGHAWGTPTYVWAEDNSSVTATRVCGNNPAHVETETVSTTSAVTKPATCEANGETTYTATFENEAFETQTKTLANVPAFGHNYGTPTYTWTEDYSKVTATRVCINDESHIDTETVNTTSVVTPPTCEEDGYVTYTASFRNSAFEQQTKKIAGEPATGHQWGTPAYEWADDNSKVTATRICENDPTHIETEEAAVTSEVTKKPTCEGKGETTYTAVFENTAFETQTKVLEDIPATGHTPVTDPAVPATCEETGLTEGSHCSVCGKVLTAQNTVPAIGHDYVALEPVWEADGNGSYTVTAKAVCSHDASHVITETVTAVRTVVTEPTATTEGLARYTATFENDLFETAVREEPIPVLRYDDPEYTWTETADGYVVTGERTCLDDPSKSVTETVTATYAVVTAPGCETEGLGRYTAVFENGLLSDQTKDVVLPATGHDWGAPEYTWSADNSKATGTRICANDPEHKYTETVDTTSVVTAPTCEEGGYTTYTAEFTKEGFTTQTKVADETEALGHAWGEPVWKWEDDFSKATATFTCEHDADHVKEIEAEVKKESSDAGYVYTATVTGPDGEVYTDTRTEAFDDILRIFGSGRYETAFKNANKLKEELGVEKFSTVVVATGTNFPDSLSGAYLANVKNAPILLINKAWAGEVSKYISENLIPGGTICAIGGEGVVKSEWLDGSTYYIERLAGTNRYKTNLEILDAVDYSGGNILVATGKNYPDSLAGSSLDMPILLVSGDTLSEEQKAFLEGLDSAPNFYIAGGTGAVSGAMEELLGTYGTIAKRFAGSNRYQTSRLIAEEFFGDADMAVLAVGNNYPDGLSVGSLAAKLGAPILLANDGKSSEAQTYTDAHDIMTGIVIGGPALISDDTAKEVLHNDTIVIYEQ